MGRHGLIETDGSYRVSIKPVIVLCFYVLSLFHASTCFEHHVLLVRGSKLYYTASGIITPVGGRPLHRLKADTSFNLCTGRPPTGVVIPEAV